MKAVDRGRRIAGAVLHVIDRHAIDIAGPGQRRAEAQTLEGQAAALGHRILDWAPVIGEIGDQAVDQIAGREVGNVGNHLAQIDYRFAIENAEPEIIEKKQFHRLAP